MSVETFKARWPENVPGLYYVSDRCIDCGACRALAPGLFQRSDPGQYSYVARQPVSAEELRLAAQIHRRLPHQRHPYRRRAVQLVAHPAPLSP